MKVINKFLIIGIWFIWSCSSSDDPVIDKNVKLVDVQLVAQYSKNDIIQGANALLGNDAAMLTLLVNYDVKAYKLTYLTTTPEGKEITASGALVIPNFNGKIPLISIQHGTLFNESDAPSYFKLGTESTLGILMAASGFHVAMPDYIGYGASKAEPHPYEHALGLGQPVADMLLAVEEYFKNQKIAWNNNVLLGGYSEGGYATMAAHKYIQENTDIQVKAVSAGAGAYYKSMLLDEFIKQPTAGEVNHNRSYIWVLQAYNRIYNFNRPMSDFFKEPYASQIQAQGPLASISGSFNSLLNPTFIENYLNGKETALQEAFKDNDLISWKSNAPVYLMHGTADTYVPYINSEYAFNGMKQAGTAQIELKGIEGGDHTTSITEYIKTTYLLFLNHIN